MGRMRTEGTWIKPRTRPKTLSISKTMAHLQSHGLVPQIWPDAHHYRGSQSWVTPMDHPCRAAWLHAIDALPWKMPIGAIGDAVLRTYDSLESIPASLALGAESLRMVDGVFGVVKFTTAKEIMGWLLNGFGPVVVGGYWFKEMWEVDRQTGFVKEPEKPDYEMGVGHAVALVGADTMRGPKMNTQAVRIINNLGISWGHVGRAWMTSRQLSMMLKGGEAYAIVPMTPEFKKKVA